MSRHQSIAACRCTCHRNSDIAMGVFVAFAAAMFAKAWCEENPDRLPKLLQRNYGASRFNLFDRIRLALA